MRWSWPSWAAIVLGLLAISLGIYIINIHEANPHVDALLIGGMVLLAAGLHALQGSYDNCCSDWCDYDSGCDCNHCAGCKGDACCGECKCCDDDDDDAHKGHKH